VDPKGNVFLLAADKYRSMTNYMLVEALREDFGDDIACGSIGPAGERQYLNSSIICTEFGTGHPNRAAARGGIGSVMGSKHLKALVVSKPDGTIKYPYKDMKMFAQTVKRHQTLHQKSPLVNIAMTGTAGAVAMQAPLGILPVRNFSGELFEEEKLKGIMPDTFVGTIVSRGGKVGQRCMPGCIARCSNEFRDADGKYVTGSLEYETISLCGPNCDISDLDMIARMDRFCDDIGIDTIDFGAAIAVAMDSGKIAWGDNEEILKIMDEIRHDKGFGRLVAQGAAYLGKEIGAKRIPTVKNQAMAAYEPRNSKGIGVTYATSPMGADHTAGMVLGQGGDPTDKDEKVYYSMVNQIDSAMQDSFMCTFNWGSAMMDPTVIADYVKYALGIDLSMRDLMDIGIRTLETELAFNKAAGLTNEDDGLPAFFRDEPSPATGAVFDFSKEELQLAKRYKDAPELKAHIGDH
jgi:aldehyde:ferredoxin oxidoreductase